MARCCGGASCACSIQEGTQVTITGVGSSQDPFVVSLDADLAVVDNSVFNLTLAGVGDTTSPWTLEVTYAATAKLDDIPDVAAAAPTNAQVLAWNSSTSRWEPAAPTTAASGSVTHDTSMTGDGSGGSPLQINEASGRFLVTSSGLGVSDAGINQMNRKYADATARTADAIAPTLNTLSTRDNAPGVVEYWTGAVWAQIKDTITPGVSSQQLLNLSGIYSGQPLGLEVRNFSGVTDGAGLLEVVSSASLAGKAGVLTAIVVPSGAQPYLPMMTPTTNSLNITARRVDDASLLVSQSVSGQVFYLTY
jgi:hypothetical protein